jgi:hypothetical protein
MKKLIILPIIFFCMVFASIAYTIVDYDDILYTASGNALMPYGWVNYTSTFDTLSHCSASGSLLYCSDPSGFLNVLQHIPNRINNTACFTLDGISNHRPLNITNRFTISLTQIPLVSQVQQLGYAGLVYIYSNSSGNTKICLHTSATESCGYIAPANNNLHNIQVDYVMYNDTSIGNLNWYTANMSVDGLPYVTISNPAHVSLPCINSTIIRFRSGIAIYNITTLTYNYTEPFVNVNTTLNLGLPPTALPQCSDGIDNDADGFIDTADLGCNGNSAQDYETPFNNHICNNNVDDDLDLLVDLDDPSCAGNPFGNTEFPPNVYQCNDGKDNDGDGLIDYGNDPSCLSYNGTTEFPAQASIQTDDICSITENCIIKNTFPYTDTIYFHGWNDTNTHYSDIAQTATLDYGLRLKNFDGLNWHYIQLERQLTNPMSYDIYEGVLQFDMVKNVSCMVCSVSNSVYFGLADSNSAYLERFHFQIDTSSNNYIVYLYIINSTGDEELAYTFTPNNFATFFGFTYIIDNIAKKITIFNQSYTLTNSTVAPTQFVISATPTGFDGNAMNLIFTRISLYGKISTQSICTEYKPPYYLKEDFSYGYLSDCGWTINTNFLVNGQLNVENTLDYLYGYKETIDTTTNNYVALTNRYSTIQFDINPKSDSVSSSILTVFVYDTNMQDIVASFTFDKSGKVYAYPDGKPSQLTTLTTDTISTIKIIFDIEADTYDFYVNGAKVTAANSLYNTAFNYADIYAIYLTSSYSHYSMDNLVIYTSDNSGTAVLSVPTIKVSQNSTYLFGIIYKTTPPCSQDSDCASGSCFNGACSNINYKLCDANGMERTNWCLFKLFIGGFLNWIVNLILDNFLLFIGLLILLMFSLFIWGHMRKGG